MQIQSISESLDHEVPAGYDPKDVVKGSHVLYRTIQEASSLIEENDFYIACASANPNSLNLWRNYSGGQGYAIGLDRNVAWGTVNLERNIVPYWTNRKSWVATSDWKPVVYDPQEQRAKVESFIQGQLHDDSSAANTLLNDERYFRTKRQELWAKTISLAATFKDFAFSGEEEVRQVFAISEEVVPSFRAGGSGLVPYIEIGVAGGVGYGDWTFNISPGAILPIQQMPIIEVVCGPSDEVSHHKRERAAISLLAAHGHTDVKVTSSKIPIAGWA